MEADADARGTSDLGSRAEREARKARKEADEAALQAERRSRFDHALAKANYASLALRPESELGGVDGDEDEDELYKSLDKCVC